MKATSTRFHLGCLAALFAAFSAQADLTNITVGVQAQTRGGAFANDNIDEVAANYLFVKFNAPSLDTARKVYLEFDLTDAAADTVNQPATLTIRGFANSQRQHVRLWALNQAYPGFSADITWNTAQANDTASNDLLTDPANPFTATALDAKVAAGGATAINTFTVPKPWGQFVQDGKLILVLAGVDDATNQANGLRFALNDAQLTFHNTVGNQPVSFSAPTNQTVYAGQSGTNYFTVSDDTTPAGEIIVWAESSNENLISAASFNLTGYGISGERTVEYAATAGQSGSAVITLNAMDNLGAMSTVAFTVTVLPTLAVNPPPYLTTRMNQPTEPTVFTISSAVAPVASVTLTGTSANPVLVADSGISLTGTGTERTVVVTPNSGQSGVAILTLTADDGVGNQASGSFAVMVVPDDATVFFDPFAYPDGFLTSESAGFWSLRTSGTTRLTVTNQEAVLRSSGGSWESVLAPLAGGPFGAGGGSVFYTHCTATWTAMPRNSTGPFVHLADAAGNLLARVHTVTNNLPEGVFRLGIASGPGSSYTDLALNLAPDVPHRIVSRYDPDTGVSALWVNATSESDPHVIARDVPITADLTRVGLRQQAGMGTLTVDDLKVIRVVRPVISGIAVDNGSVTLTFIAGPADQPADFELLRAAAAAGPYTATTAVINAGEPGSFTAVVPVIGAQGFYKVLRRPMSF